MRKPLQFILLSFLFISLDATTNMPNKSSYVGDISIKGLFESNQEFQENYSEYNSNSLLDFSLFRDVEIFVLFGTWCHDSKREVPRFLKLLSDSKVSENQINLISEILLENEIKMIIISNTSESSRNNLKNTQKGLNALNEIQYENGGAEYMVYGTIGRTGIYQIQNLLKIMLHLIYLLAN